MADQKITQLNEDTTPAITDLLVTVDDPAGTPVNKKAQVINVLKSVNLMTANTTPAAGDKLMLIDDPSGSALPQSITVDKLFSFVTGSGTAVAGDVIYYGTAGAWTRLAAGTAGAFLQTNGTATAPAWAAVSPGVGDGWTAGTGTWSYSSVDDPTGVITINADVTGVMGLGDRIKFTNGGNTIYGIVTKISYSAPNTTLTFLHEIDPADSLAKYLLANSAITNPYYSHVKNPYGFPPSPASWTVYVYDTTIRSQAGASVGTWYNLGSLAITIPIGLWILRAQFPYYVGSSGATYVNAIAAVSTSTSSASDADLQIFVSANGASGAIYSAITLNRQKTLALTSKATYYLIEKITAADGGTLNIYVPNDSSKMLLEAICAYL